MAQFSHHRVLHNEVLRQNSCIAAYVLFSAEVAHSIDVNQQTDMTAARRHAWGTCHLGALQESLMHIPGCCQHLHHAPASE